MTYKILRTDKADEQLRDILFYIADDSGNAEIALKYLDKIESAVKILEKFPKSGNLPRYSILRRQGYRVLIAGNHLVFYKIREAEKAVVIYSVADSRREYLNLI